MSSCFTWTGPELTACINVKTSAKMSKEKKKGKKKGTFNSHCFGNYIFFIPYKFNNKKPVLTVDLQNRKFKTVANS